MKTILVTGGAGFIASNFVRYILKKYPDYHILVLDALTYAGCMDNLPRDPRVQFWFGNVRNSELVNKLVAQCDTVVHAAAETHVTRSIFDNLLFFETDVLGTQAVANAVVEHRKRIERFIHISTSEVYGTAKSDIMNEDHPLLPASPYASAKAGADRLVYSYWHTYDIPAIILRPFNNYGCYSSDTEVLTSSGFVPFPLLKPAQSVAQWNPRASTIEYVRPTEQVAYWFNGDMVRFSGKQVDLLVTPNHRIWVRGRRDTEFRVRPAAEALGHPRYVGFQVSGRWLGYTPPTYSPCKVWKQKRNIGRRGGFSEKLPTDADWFFDSLDWARLLAWYLSEGSVSDNTGGGKVISIRQCNAKNREEISRLLGRMGLRHTVCNRDKEGRVTVCSKELGLYFNQFGHARDKFVPPDFKQWGTAELREFLVTYGKGDGNFAKQGFGRTSSVGDLIQIGTASARMKDDLQEIAFKVGAGSSSRRNAHGLWNVTFSWRSATPILRNKPELVPYSGYVYCITVPTGLIIVRRNGKVVICGNSFQHLEKVIPRFITSCILNEPITIHGDGQASRDWLYVGDMCAAVDKALHCDLDAIKGEVINIGSGHSTAIKSIAEKIVYRMGASRGLITYTDDRPGQVFRHTSSTEKAERLLGWKAETYLDAGLEQTITWYKQNKSWWEKQLWMRSIEITTKDGKKAVH